MAKPTPSALRPEAGPQPLYTLTEYQQKAVARLFVFLKENLDEIANSHAEKIETIDRYRRTRLIFWSGEAGVGKTSAYLSAHHWFGNRIGRKETTAKICKVQELEVAITAIGECSKRVRWLEPLDLEPLSGRPNFLAAVAVRISDALGRRQVDNSEDWVHAGGTKLRDAETRFQQLKNDIALSWEGNLPDRGSSLEPDVYAAEVNRAEEARLNVNLRFRQVIADLATYAPDRGRDLPLLFVLPIDDFYLKPDVTLELLRFLRMISCPHLFILMMGDIDLVESLALWNSLGEATRLMGSGAPRLLDERMKQDVIERAQTIASAALHKLIPKTQQFRLRPMNSGEALAHRPRKTSANDYDEESLYELLKMAGLSGDENILGIAEAETDTRNTSLWFVQDALEMPARHIADLHRAFVEHAQMIHSKRVELESNRKPGEPLVDIDVLADVDVMDHLIEIISDQVERALFESLPTEEAASVWSAMSRNRVNVSDRKFPEQVLKFEAFKADWRTKELQGKRFKLFLETTQIEDSSPARRRAEPTELAPRVRGWLAILHDALVARRGEASGVEKPTGMLGGCDTFANWVRSSLRTRASEASKVACASPSAATT